MTDLEYNPYAFDLHDDPYRTYRRLREEAPAYWNDDLRFWALSRFADVHEAFRDHQTYISGKGIALETRGTGTSRVAMLIETDPLEHTALRKVVSRLFSGRKVEAMEAEIRRIVTGYIDGFIEKGSCDLVPDLTGPFPMDVISAVLGIPESDRSELRRVADNLLIRGDGEVELPADAVEAMFELATYFSEDIPRRRRGEGEGLFTELARADHDGRSLTDDELLGFCVLFVIAGHETTTKMVANAIEVLSRHTDQRRALEDDLSLVPGAVEEVLRFHSSTQYMHRTLSCDVEMHGELMRAGDSVLLLIGAANHDDREFGPTAEVFDLSRRPERHLAFGHGAHYCLGAALARMEGKVALEEVHRRFGDFEVDHDAKIRFHSGNVTGWSSLPVVFSPAPSLGAGDG